MASDSFDEGMFGLSQMSFLESYRFVVKVEVYSKLES